MADDAPYCGKEWAAGWAAPYLACHEQDSTGENLACIAGLDEVLVLKSWRNPTSSHKPRPS